jgi:Fe-S cluster biogenesis protein NfuA/nitrite reductase/ring-hydroxylating ferredoxin subunit
VTSKARISSLVTLCFVMAEEKRDLQKRMARIDELVSKIETLADPNARSASRELVQSLMDLHGGGIERMLEIIVDAREPGLPLIDQLAADDLVASLLLLYGLHPLELDTRVLQALDKVRPYLRSHGGNVELLGVDDGVVRLKLEGSCHGCASSALTLKLAIEEAIYDAAPDVIALEVEGVVQQQSAPALVKLQGKAPADSHEAWAEVSGLESLVQGAAHTIDVRGYPVLFCKLDETLYAYSSTCRGCGQGLEGALFDTTALICPNCGSRYDVVRAGRGVDQPDVYLQPFPLLVEQGVARVALPA